MISELFSVPNAFNVYYPCTLSAQEDLSVKKIAAMSPSAPMGAFVLVGRANDSPPPGKEQMTMSTTTAPQATASGATTEPEVYRTTDFYLACYLRHLGYALADLEKERRRSVFVFWDRPERRADLMAFFNDEGSHRPLSFVGVIRDMKALIHNA